MTTMRKDQISEMLFVMSEMTKAACEGTNFVEISTYVKNHCPGIEPEFVEVFRDAITPIVVKQRKLARLDELTKLFEEQQMDHKEYEEWNYLLQELGLE